MDIQSAFDRLAPDRNKLAELIIIGGIRGVPKSEMACGMCKCPFHQYTRITSQHGIDSICNLPGDGGNILDQKPFWQNLEREVRYKHGGKNFLAVARLPKCLALKPLSPKAK